MRNKDLKKTIIILFVVFFSSIHASGIETYNWKLESKKNGCVIYTSRVKGQPFKAAKCVSVINAPIEVIGVVLRDFPSYPQWMEDCKATKILKVIKETDINDALIVYVHQGVPVISDRDVVLESNASYNYNRGYFKIEFRSTNQVKYGPINGNVRMKRMVGMWRLDYINRNKTRCTYVVNAHLGGMVPGWIANPALKKLPYKTMVNLKKMAQKEKYRVIAKKSKYYRKMQEAIKKGYLKK